MSIIVNKIVIWEELLPMYRLKTCLSKKPKSIVMR